jgi:hypothetical protein
VHLDTSKWEVIDLCSGGFRINDKSVSEAIEKVDTLKSDGLLRDYVASSNCLTTVYTRLADRVAQDTCR